MCGNTIWFEVGSDKLFQTGFFFRYWLVHLTNQWLLTEHKTERVRFSHIADDYKIGLRKYDKYLAINKDILFYCVPVESYSRQQ